MFNPSDHEGWLVWVCLLCINPLEWGGGLVNVLSHNLDWGLTRLVWTCELAFSLRFSKLLMRSFSFLTVDPLRLKCATHSSISQDAHKCWQVCVWGRRQMTHLSFYFQAFFGAPSKHEGSSRDGGLANLPALKLGIFISPATAQKKKRILSLQISKNVFQPELNKSLLVSVSQILSFTF